MALARMDIPGLVFYNGSIAPGRYDGKDVTIQDVFEGVGRYLGGSMTGAELHALESAACPGAGACGGQFTANTMATALDFLGISPAALSGIPATNERKADAALAAGRLVMDVVRRDLRPSQLITRDGARERRGLRGRHRRLDERRPAPDRDRARARHRLRRSTTSSASPRARRSSRASSPAAASSRSTCTRPAASVWSRASCRSATSSTPARRASTAARSAISPRAPRSRPARRSWWRSSTRSSRAAASRSSTATSRPRAASSSSRGTSGRTTAAPRAYSTPRRTASRPSRRARCRRATSCASATRAPPAARGCARCSTSRRPSSARAWARTSPSSRTAASRAPRTASWSATSHPRRRAAGRSRRCARGTSSTVDVASRELRVDLSDDEIAERLRHVKAPPPRYTTGVFAKYAALVRSASDGAITRPPQVRVE